MATQSTLKENDNVPMEDWEPIGINAGEDN
jgi:hypothetical protein